MEQAHTRKSIHAKRKYCASQCETDNVYCDRAPGGELQMILDRDEVPEERQVARLLKQILDGIAFLHSLNVAHLDIKVSVFKHSNYVYMVKVDLTPTVWRRCGC